MIAENTKPAELPPPRRLQAEERQALVLAPRASVASFGRRRISPGSHREAERADTRL